MGIEWDDNLASGSAAIDTQHRELFLRINSMLAAFENAPSDRQEIGKVIQYLTDYVVFHFGTEEMHMNHYNYSSMSAHKAQHAQFVKTFLKLKDRLLLEGINPALGQEIRDLCVDWLINHIKYSDRALGMFLKHKMK